MKHHKRIYVAAGIAAVALTLTTTACGSSSAPKAVPAAAQSSTSTVVAAASQTTAAPAPSDPNGQQCSALDSLGYCPGDDPSSSPATISPAAPASPPSLSDVVHGIVGAGVANSATGVNQGTVIESAHANYDSVLTRYPSGDMSVNDVTVTLSDGSTSNVVATLAADGTTGFHSSCSNDPSSSLPYC
jgi:hypothetical protein